jgi:hypothetical protein
MGTDNARGTVVVANQPDEKLSVRLIFANTRVAHVEPEWLADMIEAGHFQLTSLVGWDEIQRLLG